MLSLHRRRGGRIALASALTTVLALFSLGLGPSSAAPSQDELDAAQARLMELEADFEIVAEEYNLVNERLTHLQQEIAVTEEDIKEIQGRLDRKQDSAVTLAVELYKGGTSAGIETLLTSESLSEVESRLQYLRTSEQAQSRVFERLAVERELLDDKIAQLERDTAEALDAKNELADLRSEIDSKIASQRDEIAELNEAIAAAEERREAREAAAAAAAAALNPVAAPISAGVTAAEVGAAPAPNPRAQQAVDAALSQVGKPYQYGAAGPSSYDCSGLTMWSWAQAGVSLPHNSGAQYSSTPRVAQSDLAPGDLLFFGSPIHHVGMYIGNGQMVEAPYTGAYVRVTSAFRSDYVGAGRPGT